MNNTEKILEHLAKSSKSDDNKRDARAAMDAKTVQLITNLIDRCDARKAQAGELSSQNEALQELLRRRNAEIEIMNTAFHKVCDIVEKP